MIDTIRDIQKLANKTQDKLGNCNCDTREALEQIILRLDVIAANGIKQRQLCAEAFKQCGMYAGIQKMETETQQLIDIDLDHTVNDEHDEERY